MSAPRRFHARRGQRLARGQKLVGRNSRWGNPFPVERMVDRAKPPKLVQRYSARWQVPVDSLLCATPEEAVARYREALLGGELDYDVEKVRHELAGFDLGCPCGLEACHADVLLEVANAKPKPG